MRRIYITFGGASYDRTIEHIVCDAEKYGASEPPWIYDDAWLIEHDFYRLNHWLWDHKPADGNPAHTARGFGWFAWKPLIILDALSRLAPGDVVLYTDADTFPITNFGQLYDECARIGGLMLFAAQGQNNRRWCKRDAYIVMAQDEPRYHNMPAGVARFMLFQKGPWRPQQFLMEWLTYCVNPRAQTFDPSVLGPELPVGGQWNLALEQHRTEQAIMTLLAGKYGAKLYREACGFGQGAYEDGVDADLYNTVFHQEYCSGDRTNVSGSKFGNMRGKR